MNNLTGLAGLGFWIMCGMVPCTAVAATFWARTREQQMRHDVIIKLLETGKSLDPETLDRLLATPARGASPGPTDPRAGYRQGNFIIFMIGFATLLYAFLRHSLSYSLIGLGVFAIVLAFRGWWGGDRQFRNGTLPTLKYKTDPRQAHLSAGFVYFLIGYATLLIAVTREARVSYPIIGLGLLLVLMCLYAWRSGNKEYLEGRLTGTLLDQVQA